MTKDILPIVPLNFYAIHSLQLLRTSTEDFSTITSQVTIKVPELDKEDQKDSKEWLQKQKKLMETIPIGFANVVKLQFVLRDCAI